MATQNGKTWLGQQWLNSLSKIDNSNRLPRGRTYANKGLVKILRLKRMAMGNLLVEFIKNRFGSEPLFLHGGIDRKTGSFGRKFPEK